MTTSSGSKAPPTVPRSRSPLLGIEHYLPYQLALISQRLALTLEQRFQHRHAFSRNEWRVLALVAEMPQCTAAELVTRSGMDAVAVHRALKKLHESQLVAQVRDIHDGRLKRQALTKVGRRTYDDIVPLARQLEDDLLKGLKPRQVALLRQMLRQLFRESQTHWEED